MKYYVVDAFAKKVFSGNPAGICMMEQPLEKKTMQRIAAENNLSEDRVCTKKKRRRISAQMVYAEGRN